MEYGNRPFPQFTSGDFGWGGMAGATAPTPETAQRTNPGDTKSDGPGREDVKMLGVSFPWATAMAFMLIGVFGVGWYFTARLR
jgi:hypothetical protein